MFTMNDANNSLKNKNVCIIGYGNQGRPQALNLRDSGIPVSVALREGSPHAEQVKEDGLTVVPLQKALQISDVFAVLIPDEAHGDFFCEYVYDSVRSGQTFLFAHGFSIHFKYVDLSNYPVNVGLIAPKGPGTAVRERFVSGEGLPGIVGFGQDFDGSLREIVLGYAGGIGLLKRGCFETSFREETITDIFGEQVSLCGGTVHIMKEAFSTLVNAGFSPEMAYFETIFEMKAIVDLIYTQGISGMREKISDTAEFGAYDVIPALFDNELHQRMEKRLHEIEDGTFAERWMQEYRLRKTGLYATRKAERDSLVGQTEVSMRKKGLI